MGSISQLLLGVWLSLPTGDCSTQFQCFLATTSQTPFLVPCLPHLTGWFWHLLFPRHWIPLFHIDSLQGSCLTSTRGAAWFTITCKSFLIPSSVLTPQSTCLVFSALFSDYNSLHTFFRGCVLSILKHSVNLCPLTLRYFWVNIELDSSMSFLSFSRMD